MATQESASASNRIRSIAAARDDEGAADLPHLIRPHGTNVAFEVGLPDRKKVGQVGTRRLFETLVDTQLNLKWGSPSAWR
jgi:hypothetical protein